MVDIQFEEHVLFFEEQIGDKYYTGIVNSPLTEPAIAVHKNEAILSAKDNDGHSEKLAEEEFDTKEEAIRFLQDYKYRLILESRT